MRGYSRSKEDFRELLYSKYYIMDEIENWCLWTGVQATDYTLCDWFEDKLPILYSQDNIIYEYNQYNQTWSTKSCTIFSAIGAISDLFNYEFSLDEIKQIDDKSYTLGRVKNWGWWVQSAVKLVADRWNEKHSDLWKVAYYLVDLSDNEKVKEILDKGYTLMTNYQWNSTYNKDYKADLILNGINFWTSTYGHAVNVRNIKGKRSVKDSNKGREYNIYELEHKLSEISCYSSNWYLYTKVAEDALEEIKRLNELKTKIVQVIELNSSIWNLINDTTYKNSLHKMNEDNRKKLKTVEELLTKYM
jgi:hypothetical protein